MTPRDAAPALEALKGSSDLPQAIVIAFLDHHELMSAEGCARDKDMMEQLSLDEGWDEAAGHRALDRRPHRLARAQPLASAALGATVMPEASAWA